MALRSNNIALFCAAVAASAALGFYGTGLHPLWFLTWFAPLPVYLLATRSTPSGE